MDPRSAAAKLASSASTLPIRTASRQQRNGLFAKNSRRTFSHTPRSLITIQVPQLVPQPGEAVEHVPRWKETPRQMKLPFQVRKPANQPKWDVNEDPKKLHEVYDSILGTNGWQKLSEETRWLAVTHKSFDQGRRGFNDRLSYLGKRIVELEASLVILASTRTPLLKERHSQLKGLPHLEASLKEKHLRPARMAQMAIARYSLDKVIRWKPKDTTDPEGSGLHLVTSQALYAIVGAVALERGAKEANELVKVKILRPLALLL